MNIIQDFDLYTITVLYHVNVLKDYHVPMNEHMICLYLDRHVSNYNRRMKSSMRDLFIKNSIEYFEKNETGFDFYKILYVKMSSFLWICLKNNKKIR